MDQGKEAIFVEPLWNIVECQLEDTAQGRQFSNKLNEKRVNDLAYAAKTASDLVLDIENHGVRNGFEAVLSLLHIVKVLCLAVLHIK